MPKLTEAEAARRRKHILDAALRCFAELGFHRTSMTDLYEAAGVSAGSVYSWFDSKDDIVIAAVERNTPDALRTFEEATVRWPAREAFARLIEVFASMFDRPGWQRASRVNVQLWGEALTDERVGRAFLPAFESYRGIFARAVATAQRTGAIRSDIEPVSLAQVVWGIFLGLEAQKAWSPDLDVRGYAKAAAALLEGDLSGVTRKGTQGMSERNKEVVRRFIDEVFNQRRADLAEPYFAKDYEHASMAPGLPPGFEGFAQIYHQITSAFPDLRVEIDVLVGEDDTVMAHTRWSGTHQGPFMGAGPSGNEVAFDAMELWRMRDGRFAAHRIVFDRAGLMAQLGAKDIGPEGVNP